MKGKDCRVILHNIRSTHNVGSLFRTSDACGVSKVYISGYTPAPVDQFGRKRKDVAKTALGAEDSVAWEKIGNVKKCIVDLKKDGFTIIAIEQSKNSVDYKKVKLGKKSVILVGNEVVGISPSILSLCDIVAEIQMKGKKESLNVSVAFGVALFGILGI
jgi:tRNA G18 (ribose-2'-O)-methylase SpoU